MKKQLLFLLILILPLSIIAQDGYNFTLVHNGGYSFSVAAVPNYDSGSYTPLTQGYGFSLVVPAGVTITVDNLLPAGTNIINPGGVPQFFQGSTLTGFDPAMADKDLYVITTDTNAGSLPSHLPNDQLPLVTFTVNGAPVTGNLTLLDNNSTLATALAPGLDSFIQVDVTDDANANFVNGYLGQTGLSTFSFSTLGIIELEELGIELYPNPTQGILYLKGNINTIEQIEIFNLTGQLIKNINNQFNIIDISDLNTAIYILRITVENSTFKTRIIKK